MPKISWRRWLGYEPYRWHYHDLQAHHVMLLYITVALVLLAGIRIGVYLNG